MRFHRLQSAAQVCTPTRASITTQRYYDRMKISAISQPVLNRELMIPELVQGQVNATAHIAKWQHCSLLWPGKLADDNRPVANYANHALGNWETLQEHEAGDGLTTFPTGDRPEGLGMLREEVTGQSVSAWTLMNCSHEYF